MCQFIHVRFTPEEKKEVRKLSGIMIPIYASLAFVLFAVVVLARLPSSGEAVAVAVAKNSSATAEPARR
jgi:hypothetical protein